MNNWIVNKLSITGDIDLITKVRRTHFAVKERADRDRIARLGYQGR
jgi:hypothetical protein